jgi:hypothetical protein
MPTATLQRESSSLLQSRTTFWVLQLLDLVTTLLAFRMGAFEVNPLIAGFTHLLGPTRGLILSKAIPCVLVLRIHRLMWVANLLYTGVICWNCLILFALSYTHR